MLVSRARLHFTGSFILKPFRMGHNELAANGNQCLNSLSQPRGQPHRGDQIPDSADSDSLYDPGSVWNERVPISRSGGLLNIGGVFGSGSTGPFIFSALDPNSIEQHHVFSQALRTWSASRNIDIDKFLISVPAGLHRLKSFGGLHTGADNWNAQWMRYYNATRNTATREQMFDFAKQLVKKFKIGGFPGGSTFEAVPILFVDTCKLNPYRSVCLGRRSSGPMF